MEENRTNKQLAVVHSVQQLLNALEHAEPGIIRVAQDLYEVPPVVLQTGKAVRGLHRTPPTLFFSDAANAGFLLRGITP